MVRSWLVSACCLLLLVGVVVVVVVWLCVTSCSLIIVVSSLFMCLFRRRVGVCFFGVVLCVCRCDAWLFVVVCCRCVWFGGACSLSLRVVCWLVCVALCC